jgi:hypothetical protein
MVVDTEQNDVMSQLRVRHEPFRNADSSLSIELDVFGSRVKEPEVVSYFRAVRRSFLESFRQALKGCR